MSKVLPSSPSALCITLKLASNLGRQLQLLISGFHIHHNLPLLHTYCILTANNNWTKCSSSLFYFNYFASQLSAFRMFHFPPRLRGKRRGDDALTLGGKQCFHTAVAASNQYMRITINNANTAMQIKTRILAIFKNVYTAMANVFQ